ncbi:potassium transporter TrkG [Mycoplasmopsis edwardii]|uniref:TrkH family potassium uptake protein n=1 Tax=Mycoplasmopsis edwardii TaxID=53558 RepID=A0ACD4PI83_9BACT|nr:potassium transporter TrkG [Mycoplasmopsis edwardii]WBP84312.1 TrkH family potassium uptake protein [Mycoplasmopsis edwardii]
MYTKKVSKLKYLLLVYFLIISLSSLLLWSPYTQQSPETNWFTAQNYVDALFTTASAFSDTGLVVKNTYSHWNILGQAVIAILILSGGIGIFALKFFLINLVFKKKVTSLDTLKMIQHERGHEDVNKISNVLKSSVTFILITSLLSGVGMSFYFYYSEPTSTYGIEQVVGEFVNPQYNWELSFRFGFFHTISAINNAGFDIISGNSLMPYYGNITLQVWFIVLLIIGGLGYPVIYDIHRFFKHIIKRKAGKYRFSLFTKVSTLTYFLVFLVGFLIFFGFEYTSTTANSLWNKVYVPNNLIDNYTKWVTVVGQYKQNNSELGVVTYKELLSLVTLEDKNVLKTEVAKEFFDLLNTETETGTLKFYLSKGYMYGDDFHKVFAILFSSLSTRSAGFATVNMRDFTRSSIMVMIIMMIIGAAPASTGGGIRTTTFAVIILSVISVILSRNRVRVFKRAIEPKTVFMSVQVFVIALIILIIATLICFTSFDLHGGNIHTNELSINNGQDVHNSFYESEHIWFEVASAFGTTGLSAGVTKEFNIASKITLIFVMFIGQFGISSTLLVWKRKNSNKRNYEYVTADIVIG